MTDQHIHVYGMYTAFYSHTTTSGIFPAYLYSFGKNATQQVTEQVSKTAQQLKDTIDDKVSANVFTINITGLQMT